MDLAGPLHLIGIAAALLVAAAMFAIAWAWGADGLGINDGAGGKDG